ncbi:MAG: hypothetical protein RIQ89_1136, partial [Bacteroidota bacterium]
NIHAAIKNPITIEKLYANNFRTLLFYGQALCRIGSKIYDAPFYSSYRDIYKTAEDAFGKYDFYFSLVNLANKKAQKFITKKISEAVDDCETSLKVLTEENFKLEQKIAAQNWPSAVEEGKEFKKFYRKEIQKIINDLNSEFDLNELENGIHELRRKMRWLSMYAHALPGSIVLSEKSNPSTYQYPFLTKEAFDLPFNQVSSHKQIKPYITLPSEDFVAVGWLITELGKIKDKAMIEAAIYAAQHESEILEKKIPAGIKIEATSAAQQKVALVIDQHQLLNNLLKSIKD